MANWIIKITNFELRTYDNIETRPSRFVWPRPRNVIYNNLPASQLYCFFLRTPHVHTHTGSTHVYANGVTKFRIKYSNGNEIDINDTDHVTGNWGVGSVSWDFRDCNRNQILKTIFIPEYLSEDMLFNSRNRTFSPFQK